MFLINLFFSFLYPITNKMNGNHSVSFSQLCISDFVYKLIIYGFCYVTFMLKFHITLSSRSSGISKPALVIRLLGAELTSMLPENTF